MHGTRYFPRKRVTPTSATSFSTAAFRAIDGTNHLLYVRIALWVTLQRCYISETVSVPQTANGYIQLTQRQDSHLNIVVGVLYRQKTKEVSKLSQALQQ